MKRGFRRNIFEIVAESFEKLFSNYSLVLPFVFSFLASFILGASLSLAGLSLEELNTRFLLLSSIAFLVLWLANSYFFSGAIGICIEIVKARKAKLAVMHSTGKKFFFRYWLFTLILGLIIVIWFALTFLLYFSTRNLASLLVLLPFPFFFVFFVFAPYLLLLNDVNVLRAIKQSFALVKSNYWTSFFLLLLFFIMHLVSLVPFIGTFIALLLITPAMTLAFTIFTFERRLHFH
mgnify:CR=1 FL=1